MQHTIMGKTAGGILKAVRLVKMNAGNVEIVVDLPGRPNLLVSLTDFGDMSLVSMHGDLIATLDMSLKAWRKLNDLTVLAGRASTTERCPDCNAWLIEGHICSTDDLPEWNFPPSCVGRTNPL